MCGIVGYVGEKRALPIIMDGLQRLEYRGYDSAGVAIQQGEGIVLEKAVGRLQVLADRLGNREWAGVVGIGHTRWASHGRPSDRNSHPHADCRGQIFVVHNGIIENYRELRQQLEQKGHKFASETDTEVVPHLIEEYYEGDLEEAFTRAVAELRGTYALAAMSKDEPGRLLVVRQDNPLIIGLGQGENYLASDIPAILPYTRDIYILEDGEMAIITRDEVVVKRAGEIVSKDPYRVTWDAVAAEKGGYEHFMKKEIFEQPRAVKDTLVGRLTEAGGITLPEEMALSPELVQGLHKLFIVACGTSYHAGLIGKYLIEGIAKLPVEVELASEFRYRNPLVSPKTAVLAISQSGETLETMTALKEAKRLGCPAWGITNVVGSSLAREVDSVLTTWAGPEIAVASTKAYTTQLVALTLLALRLAELRGAAVDSAESQEVIQGLLALPKQITALLELEAPIKELAKHIADSQDMFYIGRGSDYAVSMEAALKMKEISYIHAEAMAAGELKHGTLALVTEGMPVVCLMTQPHLYEKMQSNIEEVLARGGRALVFEMGGKELADVADFHLTLPQVHPLLAPVLSIIPLQLLAYHVAVIRGCDVDKPRNLSKTITIE